MKLPRRRFLYLAGAAALPTLPRVASALDYPTRLVHIIVGYAPDGATDIMARVMGQWLSEPSSTTISAATECCIEPGNRFKAERWAAASAASPLLTFGLMFAAFRFRCVTIKRHARLQAAHELV